MAEDVSDFLKDKSSEFVFYDNNGNQEKEETHKTCAYVVATDGKKNYYTKFLRGTLFDPQGMDANKINSLTIQFKKVEKDTFQFYLDYLKTKKRNRLTWAERSSINV